MPRANRQSQRAKRRDLRKADPAAARRIADAFTDHDDFPGIGPDL